MRIIPQLMFNGRGLADAIAFWRGAFPDLTVEVASRGADGEPDRAAVTIAGQRLWLFDSPVVHGFSFTPSISLVVECGLAEEVDRLAGRLADGGSFLMPLGAYDFSPRFAFIQDRIGVSWQIMQVPS